MHNKTCLKDGQPVPRRGVRYARIQRQRGEIYQLPAPCGTQPHKAPKGLKITDVDDVPDVPFYVCGKISLEPVVRLKTLVVDALVNQILKDYATTVESPQEAPGV